MEGLRRQAREEFLQRQAFNSPPHLKLHLAEARLSASRIHDVTRERVPSRDIVTRLSSPPCSADTAGLLQLVQVDAPRQGLLNIPREIFLALFDELRLEPYALFMLQRETYGLQSFRTTRSHGGSRSVAAGIDTFYLRTTMSVLIWSHDAALRWTRGIMIPRAMDYGVPADQNFDDFVASIERQGRFIGQSWLLQLVALAELRHWIDRLLEIELTALRWAETKTGHGAWAGVEWDPIDGEGDAAADADFDKLAKVSRRTGFSATALANIARHIGIAEPLGDIPDLAAHAATSSKTDPQGAHGGSDGEGLRDAAEALKLVNTQIASRRKDVEYLQERARGQLAVAFNLISQQDARSGQQVAIITAKDSAAMRILALMATFFLPGTFFATLFALPTLHWAEDEVISSRFWIYWVFALPCTALLLIVYKGWSIVGVRWIRRGSPAGAKGREKGRRPGAGDDRVADERAPHQAGGHSRAENGDDAVSLRTRHRRALGVEDTATKHTLW